MNIEILLQSITDYNIYLKIKSIILRLEEISDKYEHFYSLDEEEQALYSEEITDLHIEKNLLNNQLNSFEIRTVIEKINFKKTVLFPEYDGSKKIVIFTGSGISAESGINTYRDREGLWAQHKISEVCSDDTFLDNIEQVHNFYNKRREELSRATPNLTHTTIAEIEKKYGDDCYIITQNIDNLLEKAGCKKVLHLHGLLKEMQCLECNNFWDIKYASFSYGIDSCPYCNNKKTIKPNVVFFGGIAINYSEMFKAFDSLNNPDSIVLVLGTQGNVINISDILKNFNCKKVLNNLTRSDYIDESQFNQIYYENSTLAITKIKEVIEQYW